MDMDKEEKQIIRSDVEVLITPVNCWIIKTIETRVRVWSIYTKWNWEELARQITSGKNVEPSIVPRTIYTNYLCVHARIISKLQIFTRLRECLTEKRVRKRWTSHSLQHLTRLRYFCNENNGWLKRKLDTRGCSFHRSRVTSCIIQLRDREKLFREVVSPILFSHGRGSDTSSERKREKEKEGNRSSHEWLDPPAKVITSR